MFDVVTSILSWLALSKFGHQNVSLRYHPHLFSLLLSICQKIRVEIAGVRLHSSIAKSHYHAQLYTGNWNPIMDGKQMPILWDKLCINAIIYTPWSFTQGHCLSAECDGWLHWSGANYHHKTAQCLNLSVYTGLCCVDNHQIQDWVNKTLHSNCQKYPDSSHCCPHYYANFNSVSWSTADGVVSWSLAHDVDFCHKIIYNRFCTGTISTPCYTGSLWFVRSADR